MGIKIAIEPFHFGDEYEIESDILSNTTTEKKEDKITKIDFFHREDFDKSDFWIDISTEGPKEQFRKFVEEISSVKISIEEKEQKNIEEKKIKEIEFKENKKNDMDNEIFIHMPPQKKVVKKARVVIRKKGEPHIAIPEDF